MRTERARRAIAAGLLLAALFPAQARSLELRRSAFVSAGFVQSGNTAAHVVLGDAIQGVSQGSPLSLWHGFLGPWPLLSVAAPPPAIEPGVALAAPFPNPCATSCTIRFHAPPGETVGVEIFDVSGRRVQRLRGATDSGPERTVIWKLNGRGQERVAPGLYFVRLDLPDSRLTRTIAVTR